MHQSDSNDHDEWEDLVKRLGGTPEQARKEPRTEESSHPAPDPVGEQFIGPRDYSPESEPDEDFHPPEPGPIPLSNPRAVLSWIGVLGPLTLWILTALIGWSLPWWLSTATIASFLAGAIGLFFLLPKTWAHRSRHDGDDFGNGAKL